MVRHCSLQRLNSPMITFSKIRVIFFRKCSPERITPPFGARWFGLERLTWICLLAVAGCQEAPVYHAADPNQVVSANNEFTFQSGDTLKVSFPSVPNLDTTQQIRSDGRINLPMVGEIVAAGKTPSALEKDLVSQYSSKIVSKEVSVTIVSAPFSVFVSGAVQRPGKVVTDHPISALEAIMEAGGFDNAKADMKKVIVVRQTGGSTKGFTLDLKQALEGKTSEPFYLQRSDIVHVPEKFNWF